jgi:TolA-binding protein
LGESYYVREDYNQAALVFVEGYQSSPYGGKAPDNLLKLGMSLSRLSRGEEACATFQELNEKFPEVLGSIKARAQKEWQKAGCE